MQFKSVPFYNRSLTYTPFQVAYIFNSGDGVQTGPVPSARPAKRRKVAKTTKIDAPKQQQTFISESAFTPLFNGAESPDAVRLRKGLFETAWPVLEARIQVR
jgi:origin recognition complex subunit 3